MRICEVVFRGIKQTGTGEYCTATNKTQFNLSEANVSGLCFLLLETVASTAACASLQFK